MKSILTTLLLLLPFFSIAQHKKVKIHLGTAIFQDVKEGVAVISDFTGKVLWWDPLPGGIRKETVTLTAFPGQLNKVHLTLLGSFKETVTKDNIKEEILVHKAISFMDIDSIVHIGQASDLYEEPENPVITKEEIYIEGISKLNDYKVYSTIRDRQFRKKLRDGTLRLRFKQPSDFDFYSIINANEDEFKYIYLKNRQIGNNHFRFDELSGNLELVKIPIPQPEYFNGQLYITNKRSKNIMAKYDINPTYRQDSLSILLPTEEMELEYSLSGSALYRDDQQYCLRWHSYDYKADQPKDVLPICAGNFAASISQNFKGDFVIEKMNPDQDVQVEFNLDNRERRDSWEIHTANGKSSWFKLPFLDFQPLGSKYERRFNKELYLKRLTVQQSIDEVNYSVDYLTDGDCGNLYYYSPRLIRTRN